MMKNEQCLTDIRETILAAREKARSAIYSAIHLSENPKELQY
jgi:hypothetical protein